MLYQASERIFDYLISRSAVTPSANLGKIFFQRNNALERELVVNNTPILGFDEGGSRCVLVCRSLEPAS